jgi:hypothetical protein
MPRAVMLSIPDSKSIMDKERVEIERAPKGEIKLKDPLKVRARAKEIERSREKELDRGRGR